MQISPLIKRIHMYTGLLNFTALTIFGIIGIVATVLPKPAQRPKPAATVQVQDFQLPGGIDDRQLADHIQASLNLPLTRPAPDWALGRDRQNRLRFRLWTPARFHEILVLEKQSQIQITTQPFDVWQYLFHLHEMTPGTGQPELRTQLWAWYIEFSIWSLMLMSLSGVYLWLATRPKYRLAQVSFAVGSAIFVLFYVFIR
jgi:hypothetical protein